MIVLIETYKLYLAKATSYIVMGDVKKIIGDVFEAPLLYRVKDFAELLPFGAHIPVVVPFVQLFSFFDRPVFSFVRSLL